MDGYTCESKVVIINGRELTVNNYHPILDDAEREHRQKWIARGIRRVAERMWLKQQEALAE